MIKMTDLILKIKDYILEEIYTRPDLSKEEENNLTRAIEEDPKSIAPIFVDEDGIFVGMDIERIAMLIAEENFIGKTTILSHVTVKDENGKTILYFYKSDDKLILCLDLIKGKDKVIHYNLKGKRTKTFPS
jgi:hypothetical protein